MGDVFYRATPRERFLHKADKALQAFFQEIKREQQTPIWTNACKVHYETYISRYALELLDLIQLEAGTVESYVHARQCLLVCAKFRIRTNIGCFAPLMSNAETLYSAAVEYFNSEMDPPSRLLVDQSAQGPPPGPP